MMICPEVYMDEMRKKSLKELYKEKAELEQAIKYYETNKKDESGIFMSPSPETIYKYNKEEYLPRIEILIAEKEQNKFLEMKIDDFTNLSLKIEKTNTYQTSEDDKWCNVSIKIENEHIRYRNSGELLLEYEIEYIMEHLQEMINKTNDCYETLSFLEPDIELIFNNDFSVDLKVNLFEDGALSENYFVINIGRKDAEKILKYLSTVFPNKVNIKNEDFEDNKHYDNLYYYVDVKYENYAGDKTYCYKTTNTKIREGDKVLVDSAGKVVIAIVTNAQYYSPNTAPYPINKTKDVIELIDENTDLSKYGFKPERKYEEEFEVFRYKEYSSNNFLDDDTDGFEVSIYNRDKDNIIYIKKNFDDEDIGNMYITIPQDKIVQIIKTIDRNRDIFEVNSFLENHSLDGSVHQFYFSNGIKNREVLVYNISNSVKEIDDNLYKLEENEREYYKQEKSILKIFEFISDILKQEKIKLTLYDFHKKKKWF